jgi:nucleoside-diphosphate-sugar epimerase
MLPSLQGRRLLVVGGAGFVGSRLVRRVLADEPESVLVVDNLLSSERENLPDDPRVELREASIADDDVLDELPTELDVVFHLATYHGNQSSLADPLADHDNNLITTLKLYDRLTRLGRVGRVVYSSTGCALAEKSTYEAREVVEDEPVSLDFDTPYQISKVVGEMYSVFYARAHDLPVVRARFQNVYGPGEVLGAGRWRGTPATIWRNVTPTFVYRAIRGLPLQIHGDGSSSRDFIYVDDVVEGLLHCAGTPGVEGDVFNLASGVETPIGDLARSIVALTGGSSSVEFIPQRDWDRSLARLGSPKKSRERLGFEARTSLDDGLRATIGWTRENLDFVEQCMAKHRELLPADA